MTDLAVEPPELAAEVAEQTWYHTIALADGVVTPGFYDTRTAAGKVPLPDSLAGKRCLDIGSCDGFWAFEMERRGADEVVGVDLADPRERDWPGVAAPAQAPDFKRAKDAFSVAREVIGSSIERVDLSVYDLSPERVGRFDFVFIGNILVHLRDPVGALMAARSVVDGELLSVDVISILATLTSPRVPAGVLSRRPVPYWWMPNLAAYRQYFEKAGFELIDSGRPFFIPFGDGYYERPPLSELARKPKLAWFWAFSQRLGTPTAWARARPARPTG